jgi:bacteriorhodopsin
MILTGLIADLSTTPVRYVWYGLGVVAFCVILYLIWVPLRAQAQANPDGRIASVYVRAATFLTVFWVGYPIAWLIGPSGLALIGQEAESVLFIVLPVISKVGFSLYDLSLLRALDDGRTHARDVPTYAGAD